MKKVLKVLYREWINFKNNIYWGKKEYFVKVKKPIRIIGKKYIYLKKGVYILNNARIEAIDYWNGKEYSPMINLENNVIVGQNLHLTCANSVVIHKKVSILPNVLITDIEHCYEINKSLNETDISVGSVEIGEYTTIGTGSVILGGKNKIKIGKNVVIGANSVITKSIPDYAIVVGAPAKIVKYLDGGKNEI